MSASLVARAREGLRFRAQSWPLGPVVGLCLVVPVLFLAAQAQTSCTPSGHTITVCANQPSYLVQVEPYGLRLPGLSVNQTVNVGTPGVPSQTVGAPIWPVPPQTPPVNVPGVPSVTAGPVNGPSVGPFEVPPVRQSISVPGVKVNLPGTGGVGVVVQQVNDTIVRVVVNGSRAAPSLPPVSRNIDPPDVPALGGLVGLSQGTVTTIFEDFTYDIAGNRVTIPLSSATNQYGLPATLEGALLDGVRTEPVGVSTPGVDTGALVSGMAFEAAARSDQAAATVGDTPTPGSLEVPPQQHTVQVPGQTIPGTQLPSVPATSTPAVPPNQVAAQALPGPPSGASTPSMPEQTLLQRTIQQEVPPSCLDIPWSRVGVSPGDPTLSAYNANGEALLVVPGLPRVGPINTAGPTQVVAGSDQPCSA